MGRKSEQDSSENRDLVAATTPEIMEQAVLRSIIERAIDRTAVGPAKFQAAVQVVHVDANGVESPPTKATVSVELYIEDSYLITGSFGDDCVCEGWFDYDQPPPERTLVLMQPYSCPAHDGQGLRELSVYRLFNAAPPGHLRAALGEMTIVCHAKQNVKPVEHAETLFQAHPGRKAYRNDR